MAERFVYEIENAPVSEMDKEQVSAMPYEFGWASVYEEHVSFRTPSGYVYHVAERID
jgi:predicted RNA methylase